MSFSKRLFDIAVSFLLGIVLAPLIVFCSLLILVVDGGPIFYISERMHSPQKGFKLIKFRTMRPSETDFGATGGDKSDRVTRTGRFLRRSRLDEVPQLWNIFVGDMSFVGPRPPLRTFVERFPEIYGPVLQSRPGVTGLASLLYHGHEEKLLKDCKSAEETDEIYCRSCVPRKAQLDLIYQRNRSMCFDIGIMLKTAIPSLR